MGTVDTVLEVKPTAPVRTRLHIGATDLPPAPGLRSLPFRLQL